MKKIILFCTLFSSYSLTASLSYTDAVKPLLAPTIKTTGGLLLSAATLYALHETLRDIGHGIANKRTVENHYRHRLESDYPNILTKSEILYWSNVEGLSASIIIFKKEIAAFIGTLGLATLAYKLLASGVIDMNTLLNKYLSK